MRPTPVPTLLVLLLISVPMSLFGGEKDKVLRVAVASNFAAPANQLAAEFERKSGINVYLSFGSSGKLYAQLRHGAPFDIFLSADAIKPKALVEEGLAVAESEFVYALGQLALWPLEKRVTAEAALAELHQENIDKVAIANPRFAPYGVAALQVLERASLGTVIDTKLLMGENVAQAYHFVSVGVAQKGFVAHAQLLARKEKNYLLLPSDFYQPIEQRGVLMKNHAKYARQFMHYLQSEKARRLIESSGYSLPASSSQKSSERIDER